MRSMSKKRRAELPARRAVVEACHMRDRTCQATAIAPHVQCGGPLDVHEVIPRSAWPKGYLELSNVLLTCRLHHDLIGAHPARAAELGLHKFSWQRTEAERG